MTVATYRAPSFPTQDPATYKANIDADFRTAQRYTDAFAPHAQSTPNMTVALDAGFVFYNGALTEVAAQNTSAISPSSLAGITRIDRVVVDMRTGAVSVVAGTSVVPSLPSGKQPVAQVAVTTGSTAITNAMLTDERAFPGGRSVDYQPFTSTGAFTWNAPIGFSTLSPVIVMMWGSGAGGSTVSPGSGGGGGACVVLQYTLGQLSTSVAGVVAAGGAAGALGSASSFNGVSVYGGGIGSVAGGGGGGVLSASTGNNGGGPAGGLTTSGAGGDSAFGGGGGGQSAGANPGGKSVYGGGGGGGSAGGAGGATLYGGGGGAGNGGTGGVSILGGNGGNSGVAGSAPGGGGGQGAAGARGEVRIWVLP